MPGVATRSATRTRAALRRVAVAAARRPELAPLVRLVEPRTTRRNRRDDYALRLLLSFTLRPDSCCVDVGSNDGAMLEDFLRLAPDGRHVAFEPLPHLAERLRLRFPAADVRETALSDRSGRASFTFVRSRPAYSGFRERSYPGDEELEQIEVQVERLDDVLPVDYVPTLVKIDVEGAELEVLRGARETLRAHRPLVVFEHGKGAADHYGTRPSEVFSLLADEAGLRVFDMDGNGPYSLSGFEEAYEAGDRWNFLAHP
jgi:FkbM family methyltransferase